MAALVSLFTENASIVTEWGDVVVGRETFLQGLEQALRKLPVDLKLEITPSSVIAVTPGVMVSHGIARLFNDRDGSEERLVYTRVLVSQDGQWQLAANHVAKPSTQPKLFVLEDPKNEG